MKIQQAVNITVPATVVCAMTREHMVVCVNFVLITHQPRQVEM